MSLTDPSFLQFDGTPITGRTPAELVAHGQISAPQMAELRAVYNRFCTKKTLSLANTFSENFRLSDGSPVRITSIYGADKVEIWPNGGDLPEGWWTAYAAFVDVAFLPVYERPVIALTGPAGYSGNCTKPPKLPPPPESAGFDRPIRIKVEHWNTNVPPPDPETGSTITWQITSRVSLVDAITDSTISSYSGSYSGYLTDYAGDLGTSRYIYNNWTNARGGYQGTDIKDGPYRAGAYFLGYKPTYNPHAHGVVPPGTPAEEVDNYLTYHDWAHFALFTGESGNDRMDGIPYMDLYSEIKAYYDAQAAGQDDYNARMRAYNEMCERILKDWKIVCDPPPAAVGEYTALYATRLNARRDQIAAASAFLEGGVKHVHLAARFLTFPWNIGTEPRDPLGQPAGTITASFGEDPESLGAYFRYAPSGASRDAVVPNPTTPDDFYPKDLAFGEAPHPMSRDFADPKNLFGWQTSSSFDRYASHWIAHAGEPPEVRWPDKMDFTRFEGYSEFLHKGIRRTGRKDRVISSDGYVPAGTEITVVLFEHEVWDPFAGQWLWMPTSEITRVDSVWIQSLWRYSRPPLLSVPDGQLSVRASRIKGAYTQKRMADMSWSAPRGRRVERAWQRVWSCLGTPPSPPAVIIVTGLPASAAPIEGGTTQFPFASYAIGSNTLESVGRAIQRFDAPREGQALAAPPPQYFAAVAIKSLQRAGS